ncbi:NlpC/P60 family protein [Enterococcus faecalis]
MDVTKDERTLEQTIALQTEGAIASLRSLRSEVKQVTDEWKLQHAQLRQNGEYEEAYRAKIEGLERAMQEQRQGIDRLKQTMQGISTETKAGAEAHDKLAQEVLKAERTLQTMSEQQEKARNTLSLYESGIIQTRRELEQSERVSASYQEKLRAEGHELEANQEKRRFLGEKIKSLQELQEKETRLLEQVKRNSGETSDAYQKQAVRVNELGTKVAHSRKEFTELETAMSKRPKLNLASVREQLDKVNEKAEKTHHLFGKILGAELIGRAAIAGLQSIKLQLTEALHAGSEFNQEQQVMSAAWNTLTSDAKKAQEMVTTINDLSVATGRSRDLVNELEQGFYHLHSNKEESDNLTKSMLNMGDAVGLTDDQITTVTQDMVHGLATGKLNLQEMNQLSQYFPMFGESLLEYERKVTNNSNLTMAELRKMTTQGKISAETVEKLFNELGQDKYGKAAENMLQTMSGMKRTIDSQVPALIGAFEKPILTAQNPFYGAISKWVSDHKTQDKFTEMGNAAEKGVETILSAFGKVFAKDSAVNMADGLLDWISQKITVGSNWIAGHAPQIIGFFQHAKESIVGLFTRGKETLSGFYDIARPFLRIIQQYPKQFGEVIAVMYLAKPAISGVSLAIKGFEVFKSATGWVRGLLDQLKLFQGLKKANLFGGGNLVKEADGAVKLAKGLEESAGFMSKLEKGVPILAGLTSLLELRGMTKDTAGEHIGGALGNFGGAIAGAEGGGAIGTALFPGVGTAIGTLAGGIIGALGGTKIGEIVGKQIQTGLTNAFKSHTPIKDHFIKETDGLSDNINHELTKIGINTQAFNEKEEKKVKGLYDNLQKKTEKYFSNKQSQSKKDLDILVKNGALTQEQANNMLKTEQDTDKRKKKLIQDSYKNQSQIVQDYYKTYNSTVKQQQANEQKVLDDYAKKYGKNSKKYNDEKLKIEKENKKALEKLHDEYFTKLTKAQQQTDERLSKELNVSAKKQETILSNLEHAKHKISTEEMKQAILNSREARDTQIKDAETTYKNVKENAEKKYQDIVKAAKKERDESGTITQSQYEDIVSKAKKQRDDTISAAEDQKKKQVKKAEETHEQVVSEATKQAGEHKNAVDHETGDVLGSWANMKDNMAGIVEAVAHGIGHLIHALSSKWGNDLIDFKFGAHAQGTSGLSHDEIALVGEEGFELAHHPLTGIFPVGTRGPEIRPLQAGTSILPHDRSKQFLAMTQGLPAHASGVWGTIHNLYDWVKDKAEDAMSFVGEGANKLYQSIVDKLEVSKFIQSLGNGSGQVLAQSAFDLMKDKIVGYVQSLFDQFKNETGGTGTRGEFLRIARTQAGKPYVWGAEGPDAFDCSGLVKWALKQMGIAFPHFSGSQFESTTPISEKDAKPGDLAFFGAGGKDHVGIYSGKDRMFNAMNPQDGIRESSIHSFSDPFAGIRRINQLTDNGGLLTGNNSRWGNAILEAAKLLGVQLAPWQIQNLLKQIQTESGGNESIRQQVWDINMANGNPAEGLLQFIPQTFAQWALPGHTNIFSGFDQIIAAIRRLNAMDTWNYIGQGHGWEHGGFVSQHGYYELGEGNQEEAIIPLHKGMRSLDMLYKTMAKLGVSPKVTVVNDCPKDSVKRLEPFLLEILHAIKDTKTISINLGDKLVQVVDRQLGQKSFTSTRLELGGGAIG